MSELKVGLKATASATVSSENTALTMGSGDMEVFSTPSLVALMEKAATLVIEGRLPEGMTTVGSNMDVDHLNPSGLGAKIDAEAELRLADGRRLSFKIVAREGDKIVGEGQHVRFIVERDKFLAGL